MRIITRFISGRPRFLILALSLLLLIGLTYLDYKTGPDVRLGLFYLLPVLIVAGAIDFPFAIGMSLLCTLAWLAKDLSAAGNYSPNHHFVAYFNAIVRVSVFVAGAWLVTAWRQQGRQLERLVQERTAELTQQVSAREQAQQSMRVLAAQLADAQEVERSQLATDLHDSVGQTLSMAKLSLDQAVAADSAANPRLREAKRLLEDAIEQARTLTFDLHPSMIEDLGLGPTLSWYCERFQSQTGIQATVTAIGAPVAVPPAGASSLFRAVKELFNNAARHGRAGEILVALHWRPGGLRIVVDDDGVGFDVGAAMAQERRGLGLAAIHERVWAMGGTIAMESNIGIGTRVIIELDVAAPVVENVHI